MIIGWDSLLRHAARAALARREDAALTAGSGALARGLCAAVMLVNFQGFPITMAAVACERPPHAADIDHKGWLRTPELLKVLTWGDRSGCHVATHATWEDAP